ncbi:diaminopimelate epimerase [Pseudomonas sp. NA-150]|uniref:diaminopimelate epimerase n=1 Tax=Pseudomonas sp. NA-150 TaxID=3367525 RepID=UPI0037C71A45
MTRLYDARGNLYAVTTPQALRLLGIDLPDSAEQAALTRVSWSLAAIDALCSWPEGQRPEGAKQHRSDGLLVGPFQSAAPYDLLIVNTDGTLAERSGNGLTIFAQALTDEGQLLVGQAFTLQVHHDQQNSASPVPVQVEAAQVEEVSGFWLDLGAPGFGPTAVGAGSVGVHHPHNVSRVERLAELNQDWARSVFVRIGNPHCVTLVPNPDALPSFAHLHEAGLHAALVRIAFVGGEPCPAGVNLQWAFVESSNRIIARVFERGEGPTASSGTSASAVACAAWRVGEVDAGLVQVVMPGGTAPVRLIEQDGALQQVMLFGAARRV